MRRMLLKKRKKFNYVNLFLFIIIGMIFCIFFIINYVDKNFIPILKQYGDSEIRKFSNLIINNSISNELLDEIDVNKMFIILKDDNGLVQTIDFDPIVINKSLNKVVLSIQESLNKIENGSLDNCSWLEYDKKKLLKGIIFEIPSGVIFKNSLLSNLGPKIPVKYNFVGDIESRINSNVTNYGINNALIEVSIHVKLTSLMILPFITDKVVVETDIPIAFKMFHGNVPSYLVGDGSSFNIRVPSS